MLNHVFTTLAARKISYRMVSDNSIVTDCLPEALREVPETQIVNIDGTQFTDNREPIFETIAAACQFPAYAGRNWVALRDSLEELPYERDSDVLLVISDFQSVANTVFEDDFNKLTDTFDDVGAIPSNGPEIRTLSAVFCRSLQSTRANGSRIKSFRIVR